MRFASIRWGIFLLNLGTLGHWILELFAMYATDGQTDRQTDGWTNGRTKATPIVAFPMGGSIKIKGEGWPKLSILE